MQPLISVIVPVYNGETYLANCIESIEKQSYKPLEVIIVNDGSTDQTGEVCQALTEKYDNIRLISLPDLGVSAARNAGMKEAKGDYLTFVDADDRIRPPMLQMLYEMLVQTHSQVAGCTFAKWQTQRGWELLEKSIPAEQNEITLYTGKEYLSQQLLKGNSRCWSKLYSAEFIRRNHIQFREGLTIGEDMLFLMELLPAIGQIAEMNYPGYGYYQNPEGAMNRKFEPRYMDQILCWKLLREKAVKMDASCENQITSLLLMGIMLTAGKLSRLSGEERKKNEEYIRLCHTEIMREKGNFKARMMLSKAYRLKVRFFAMAPGLYLRLYHLHKNET